MAEWYQVTGFYVRRNVQVGKRAKGGYECELDIVAFHPEKRQLVHIEPSLDTLSWERREERCRKKFQAGRKYIPGLFKGLPVPDTPIQIALFAYGGRGGRTALAGGQIQLVSEFMQPILAWLGARRLASAAVPEEYPLLRTLQFAVEFWDVTPAPPAV